MDDSVLDDATRAEFRAWQEMFDTTGWALFKQLLEKEIADLPLRAFSTAEKLEELLAGRAVVRKLKEIVTLPERVEALRQNAIEAALADIADEREASRQDY